MSPSKLFPFGASQSNLERSYPHIVERLRPLWGYPEGKAYLSALLVDHRGGRQGFSSQVFSEILDLLDNYPQEFSGVAAKPAAGIAWRSPGAVFADSHDLSRRRIEA